MVLKLHQEVRNFPSTVQVVVRAETPLNPSEDSEKVSTAIRNIMNDCYIDFKHGRIFGRSIGSESLRTIYEHVRSKAVLGVLRKALLNNRIGDTTWFLLNKQAATVGVVVIVENKEESPLGAIKVTIESDQLDTVIEWLAPKV
jgi:predicted RNA binding protein with dsRBD fold (UPF0201 family)